MNDSQQRRLGAVLSYVSIIVSTLIQLLYTPLLIRKLGQSEYGLYSLVVSILGYLTVMDLGFGNAIIVYTSKYRAQNKIEEEKKLHGMFNIVFKAIGIITVILGIILFSNINNIFSAKMTAMEIHKMKIMMLILICNMFLTFSFAIYNSIISACEKFTFQKIMAIIHSILTPLIMIPLLYLGYRSVTLCIVVSFTNIILLLANYIYCTKKLKIHVKYMGFDKKMFKTILSYSIWIFLGVIVDKINWSIDNFVLGAVAGTITVSIYSIAATLNLLFCSLSTAISGILLPKISKMIGKNANSDELTNEFIKVGRIQYLIIFLMASGFILVGKEFFILWAGKSYERSYYVALLLILPVCIPLIQNLGISIRQAMNKHKFSAIVNVIIAVLNLIISIPLAIKYGAIGAAIGTAFGILVSSFINNIYYYKAIKLDIKKFWKEIMGMTLPFIIPWGVILVFKHYIVLVGIKSILIYGSIFTIIYCISAYFLSMNTYEKAIVKGIITKIGSVIGNGSNN